MVRLKYKILIALPLGTVSFLHIDKEGVRKAVVAGCLTMNGFKHLLSGVPMVVALRCIRPTGFNFQRNAHGNEELVTDEEFYDQEVAPVLAGLAKKCCERELGFFALVEWDKKRGAIGSTTSGLRPETPYLLRLAANLSQCWVPQGGVNIDLFLARLCNEARRTGHTSVFLSRLGIPEEGEHNSPGSYRVGP